ncbi:MAG TPA: hypothetical protein VF407_08550 [Polyangiaceae bacterium]
MKTIARASLLAIAFVLVAACGGSTTPSPKTEDDGSTICGTGADAIRCPRGTFCGHTPPKPKPIPPQDVLADRPADDGGDVGEGCAGIAGRPCKQGLVCKIDAGQEAAADGAGTCVLSWSCVPGSF